MKKILFLFLVFICFPSLAQKGTESLNKLIDAWHLAATNADFKAYFAPTTDDFIFLGTAPGERWTKKEFQTFSKPYFDKGKAWDFKASNRKWNFSKDGKTAWFDEDLKTWMEDCRGSGVCIKEKGEWNLAYYNLTVLIENEKIKEFIQLRKQ
jgi:ketosteroid isomerase-like protein